MSPVISSQMEAFLNNVPAAVADDESVPVILVHSHTSSSPNVGDSPASYRLYGSNGGDSEEDDDDVDDDDEFYTEEHEYANASPTVAVLGSLCEVFLSLFFIPFWLKSIVRGVFFIRTLVLGYLLHGMLQCQIVTEQAVLRWIGCGGAMSSCSTTAALECQKGPTAWPPRTLIGLGLLTFVALIVHPEGYTWIVLRKIRDGIMFLFQSSSTCWAVAVNDYGTVASSILALSTFAALVFLVYVLHRTLSSRTPEDRRRHIQNAEKQRRKRRKQHIKGMKSCSRAQAGRSSLLLDESVEMIIESNGEDVTSLDVIQTCGIHNEEAISVQPLPTSVGDEPFDDSVDSRDSLRTDTTTESLIRISNTQPPTVSPTPVPVNYQSSCISASDRSKPVSSAANELSDLAIHDVIAQRKQLHVSITGTGRPKTMASPNMVAQSKASGSTPRRQQNRKGKRAAKHNESIPSSLPPQQLPAPSKRWDTLKPQNRANNNHQQRHVPPATTRSTRDEQTTRTGSQGVSPHFSVLQRAPEMQTTANSKNEQMLPFRHSAAFSSLPQVFTPSSNLTSFASNVEAGKHNGNDSIQYQSQLFLGTSHRHNVYHNSEEPTTRIISTLNPHSPSWDGSGVNAFSNFDLPMRPPPGLEMTLKNDIPFGCGSSDGGNSTPTSPFQRPSSMMDIYHQTDATFNCSSAPSSPFHSAVSTISNPEPDMMFLRNYQGLSLSPSDADVSLSFRLEECDLSLVPPLIRTPNRQLSENPFALRSDEEADVDKIEAELQVLGGQMVGSILDF